MKKSTLVALLGLLAAAFLLFSCTTVAQKPAPAPEAAAPEKPAPAPEAAAPEKPAPAPEAAAPEKPAPAPEAAAPEAAPAAAQPVAGAVWQATGVSVTKDGSPVELPAEFTSYPVIVRIQDGTHLELDVGEVGFAIPSTYAIAGDSLTISPLDYKNPPQLLIDTLASMGIDQLPETYYFTMSTAADGSGLLEADAMGYHMVATWTQLQ